MFRRRPRPETAPGEAPAVDAAAILRQTRRLRFRVRPEVVSLLSGAYHAARPGVGLTFAELRAYEPGDDVRHLDWNVTARQGRPYVRRFVEERALTLQLLVDVSASLRFGPEGRTKADRAAQAAALLATAAIQNGDRVGLILVSDRVEAELEPSGGIRHLARLIRLLVASPASSRQTALSAGLERLARSPKRSLLVAFSDFLTPEPAAGWRLATRRNDVMAIRLIDPREESLPNAGLIALAESESGTRRIVDSGSARVRLAYEDAARRRRNEFRSFCAAAGVRGEEIDTREEPIRPLLRLFSGRVARRVRT